MAPTALVVDGKSAADKNSAPQEQTKPSVPPSEKSRSDNENGSIITKGNNDQSQKMAQQWKNLQMNLRMKLQPGYKELYVSPGRLGISLQFLGCGAVIKAIDPACTFRDKIQIGDRIVSIDGRKLSEAAGVHVGKDKIRTFGVVPGLIRRPTTKVRGGSGPKNSQRDIATTDNHSSVIGKRKRDTTESNLNEEVARKSAPSQWSSKQRNAINSMTEMRDRAEFKTWLNGWEKHKKELTNYYQARHADGWHQRYQELVRYKRDHDGDWNNVPLGYRDPDDLTLGEWVVKQRELYIEGKLDPERVKYLEDQGFDFGRAPPDDSFTGDEQFDSKLRELIQYRKTHLNCDVPITYPQGETLGQWVHNQRELYNEGTLGEDRHLLLQKRGFVFEPGTNVKTTIVSQAWKKTYQDLVQFKRDHGHLDVPLDYQASSLGAKLGKWVGKQRGLFKRKQLSRNHIKLLEEVGLDLGARKIKRVDEGKWDSSYINLVAYREQNGHCRVPKRAGALGVWVKRQRTIFRKGKLSEEKIQRLLTIDFEFDPLNKGGGDEVALRTPAPPNNARPINEIFQSPAWISNYGAVKLFVENNGHADIPPGYEDSNVEGSLFTWIETQKRFFSDGVLPQQNIEALEELGIDLSERSTYSMSRNDAAWMNNFNALKRFHEEHGTFLVPFDDQVDNQYGGYRCLARWIQKQREFFKKNRLPERRVSLLESLGMDLTATLRKLKGSSLSKLPDDNLWFEHEDGVRRRVPSTWEFPRLSLEEMYVKYHCQHQLEDQEQKASPMKMFMPSDMVNGPRYHKELSAVKLVCGLIDQECVRKKVVIEGIMTEEEARQCVRIGYPALNIPPMADGVPRDVLRMKMRSIEQLKQKKEGNDCNL